jgi:hypothetical protein
VKEKLTPKMILNRMFPEPMAIPMFLLGVFLALRIDVAFAISSEVGFIISFMCIWCIVEWNKMCGKKRGR